MEDNRSDNELVDRIKESLRGYEEAYVPGAWEDFLRIRKQQQRRVIRRIGTAVAAMLLLGYFAASLLPTSKQEHFSRNDLSLSENSRKIAEPNHASMPDNLPEKVLSIVVPQSNHPSAQSACKSPAGKITSHAAAKLVPEKEALVAVLAKDSPQVAATPEVKNLPSPQQETAASVTAPPDTTTQLYAGEMQARISGEGMKRVEVPGKRKIRFGLIFSPGVSTTQTASSFNYMGGFSADITLFGDFQLSTGLQLENQTIVNKTQGAVATLPANQLHTKLINFDLPVNLTWRFLSEKSNSFYVSTGFSSLVYLKQEDQNTSYSQYLTASNTVTSGTEVKYELVSQVSVTKERFTPGEVFDFAGRLNVVLGIERKLSDKIFLHLEPFAKIPVGGQSSTYLKHTSTGVNFKISF